MTLEDSINKGSDALNALYALQAHAMRQGDLATQKALADDIDELTYGLTQLRGAAIADDDVRITALVTQLDVVTATAKAALSKESEVSAVLANVIAAAKLTDTIVSVVAKL